MKTQVDELHTFFQLNIYHFYLPQRYRHQQQVFDLLFSWGGTDDREPASELGGHEMQEMPDVRPGWEFKNPFFFAAGLWYTTRDDSPEETTSPEPSPRQDLLHNYRLLGNIVL